jgi:hypothetical protein
MATPIISPRQSASERGLSEVYVQAPEAAAACRLRRYAGIMLVLVWY